MKGQLLSLSIAALSLTACVSSQSGAYKGADGATQAACMDNCIDRTGNAAQCTKFATEARGSCGDLIAKVCAAEKTGKCGS